MVEGMLFVVAGLSLVAVVLLLVALRRLAAPPSDAAEAAVRQEFRAVREETAREAARQREEAARQREEAARNAQALRDEVAARLKEFQDSQVKTAGESRAAESAALDNLSRRFDALTKAVGDRLDAFARGNQEQLERLTRTNQEQLDKVAAALDARVKALQEGNEKKLEEMRRTVDEQLQGTLEKRLGESFKLVSERLEAVQRGLGEMQNLATGVGDLKRVLTNVKARGTWGEVQLGAILEQILTPEQYERNVATRAGSADRVEFAVRLPGRDGDGATAPLWLPIDAKFPQEDYLRLVEASEAGDAERVQRAANQLGLAVKVAARDIHDKYLDPPRTTDFALMFLPTEGLYAEVLRQTGLAETLLRDWRVVVAGPTTLAAILSSLRLGFHTLAIEKRSSEVWRILGAVKTEFGKFGDVLDKVKGHLEKATNSLDDTGKRTRQMARKLKAVEELPAEEARQLLGEAAFDVAADADDEA